MCRFTHFAIPGAFSRIPPAFFQQVKLSQMSSPAEESHGTPLKASEVLKYSMYSVRPGTTYCTHKHTQRVCVWVLVLGPAALCDRRHL